MTAPILSLSALLLAATSQVSQGAITFTFDDSSGDVIATITGNISVVGLVPNRVDNTGFQGVVSYSTTTFMQLGSPGDGQAFDDYSGGDVSPSGLTVGPSSNTVVDRLGYIDEYVFVNSDTPVDGVFTVTPGQTMTWTGVNLADIGLGALTTTPTTVWNNPSATGIDGAIHFVVVPEPSSVMLSLFGFVGLLRRRR